MTAIDISTLDGISGFRLVGIDASDFSGRSVSGAGDINGDGFHDLIVGATGGDPSGNSFAGESYVVFGKASGFTASVDLSGLDGTDGFRLDGIDEQDQSGRLVSGAGDVNGDGFADLIIGAEKADPNGDSDAGESYVVFGKASGFSAGIDLGSLDGTDGFRLNGIDVQDQSGNPVSGAGDVNGDGFADLIIGARGGDPNGDGYAGESYVVFGKASGFTTDVNLGDLDGTDGFRLDGATAYDRSGLSVSGAGDINGDGFNDVIVGAIGGDPNGDYDAGESYVVFGKASGFTANVNLGSLDGTDGFRLNGIDPNDYSGSSVSGAGDVNGDGFDDLIVGAYGGDPNGKGYAGESYVVFGKASGFTASVDLAGLDGSDGFRLNGSDINDLSGGSVNKAGDVNGDGFGDLIIGAFGADPNGDSSAGESYVVFGKGSGFTANMDLGDLDGTDGFRLDGIDSQDQSGGSVSGAGDVNGDGFDDLIVGAAGGDPNGDSGAGESYVVFGFDSGAVTHQGTSAGETLTGDIGANIIIGGLGADTLIGAGGLDVLRGGGGDDILDIADLGFRSANGGTGLDTLRLSGAGLSLDFTAVGSQFVASIEAIDLAGAGAKATLDRVSAVNLSEASNSIAISGDTSTLLTLADAGWSLASDNGATHAFANGAASIILGSAVSRIVTGSGAADTLLGGDGADVLTGGDGDDILTGGDGNDTLTGGDGVDTADYSGAAGLVSVNLTSGSAQDGDGGSDTLASIESVIGSGFNDVLVGNGVTNTLTGGAGNDTLTGGAGNDILTGGDGIDTADYSEAAGLVSVNLTNGAVQDGDGGSDTLISIESVIGSDFNDVLIGDGLANTLTGGDGVDRLNGRGGDDRMEGGAGNDIYTVTDIGDVVVEGVAEGTKDRINTFVDFTNPENVEFLVGKFSSVGLNLIGNSGRDRITGANKINSPDTIDGQGGNDRIIGLVGNDIINGGAGNDRIFGNSGLDVIDGGVGDDVLTGQQNADTFVVGLAAGRDTITDFNGGQDVINLSAHGFANLAAVLAATANINGSAVIDLGGANSLRLLGVLETSLASDDFILA